MRWTFLPPVVLLAVLAAPVSAAISDFRLPVDPPAEQPPPDRVGPVAPDVPESRVRPTPAPTPNRAPAPAPSAAAPVAPIVVPDLEGDVSSAPSASATRRAVSPVRPPVADAPPEPVEGASSAVAEPGGTPASEESPAVSPVPAAPAVRAVPNEEESNYLWILAALAALAAAAAAAWRWRAGRSPARPELVRAVERPRIVPPSKPDPAPSPSAPAVSPTPSEPLQVALEPLRLSLTLMNATLAYRLEIANRGQAPISGLIVAADMISAHASMTREQHLSGPGTGAATVQRIDRLEPGESRVIDGEFRLPFPQIVPIRQGAAALLLPLARFRLEAEGSASVVRTFAVGQPGAQSSLQPFRLDLGPRIYPNLAQRAFA